MAELLGGVCVREGEATVCYARPSAGTRGTEDDEDIMQELTAAAAQAIRDIGQRYGVSEDAVRTMLFAVSAGGGSMAQFYCPELGGGGQWMRGGMTMVGDMFDSGLQARVNDLCSELSSLLASQEVFVPQPRHAFGSGGTSSGSSAWWPTNLGSPSSTGGQNETQYAYFPDARRLAIREGGRVSLYDTLDHRIGGVQQQQGGAAGSLSFSSQLGTFAVGSLPLAHDAASAPQASAHPSAPAYAPQQAAAPSSHGAPPAYEPQPSSSARPSGRPSHELLAAIERLGDLHRKGVLTDAEFQTKKAELLAQL